MENNKNKTIISAIPNRNVLTCNFFNETNTDKICPNCGSLSKGHFKPINQEEQKLLNCLEKEIIRNKQNLKNNGLLLNHYYDLFSPTLFDLHDKAIDIALSHDIPLTIFTNSVAWNLKKFTMDYKNKNIKIGYLFDDRSMKLNVKKAITLQKLKQNQFSTYATIQIYNLPFAFGLFRGLSNTLDEINFCLCDADIQFNPTVIKVFIDMLIEHSVNKKISISENLIIKSRITTSEIPDRIIILPNTTKTPQHGKELEYTI